jgi:hypothetical protein
MELSYTRFFYDENGVTPIKANKLNPLIRRKNSARTKIRYNIKIVNSVVVWFKP